jgi:hypothetical protein
MTFFEVGVPLTIIKIAIGVLVNTLATPLASFPIAFISVSIDILDDPIARFEVVCPFTLVLAPSAVVVDAFAMLLSVQESALVFIFVRVDNLALVCWLVTLPLSIVDGTVAVLQNSLSCFLVLDPLPKVFVSIGIIVCAFSLFLTIDPVAFVFLSIGIVINAESIFFVLLPLAIVLGSTFVKIDSSAVFLALEEFSLVFVAVE